MTHVKVEVKRQDGTAKTLPWPPGEEESVCLAAFLIAIDLAVGTGITRRSLNPTDWALHFGALRPPDDAEVRDAIAALAQRQPDLLLPFQRFAFAEPSTDEGRALLKDGENAWQGTTEVVLASWNLRNSIPELSVLDTRYPFLRAALGTLHRMLTATPSQRVHLLLTT